MQAGNFRGMLGKLRRQWQVGMLVCAIMRATGLAAAVLTAYAVLDFFFGFDLAACLVLDMLLLLALAILFLVWIVKVFRLNENDAACRADRLLMSGRRPVLSALELDNWLVREKTSLPALQAWLMEQSTIEAGKELAKLRFRDRFPFGELGRRLKVFAIQLCIGGLIAALNVDASRAIISRIVFPLRDTPPYTKYTFKISPESPSVVYGGNTEITAEIGGAPIKAQVWFYTRYRGKIHKAACFQQSGQRFAQRMERVVSPLEFCFGTGKARSRWHKIDLLLQPEISAVNVTITPPAYTGLPRRQFQAGREPVAGHRQSKVELFVTSNRPLTDGTLSIQPKSGLSSERPVAGVKVGPDTIAFNWVLQEDADLDIVIRDIRGTPNKDPLKIEQKMTRDRPPEVLVNEPSGFSLATPRITVPLAGTASDDLALSKVRLVRTVVGYRDRSVELGPKAPENRFDFADKLDLKTLGVQPGQVLELYVEAIDSNPDLTGVTASDIVRVQVISEEEYAAMLRARSTLESFMKRYYVVRETLAKYVASLEALKNASINPNNKAEIEQKLAASREVAGGAVNQFEKIAADFVLFDTEQKLADKMNALNETVRQQKLRLDAAKAPYNALQEEVQGMLEQLGAVTEEIKNEVQIAEEINLVARVMEMSALYKELIRLQSDVVRRLERFGVESQGKDVKLLVSLGKRQEEIRGYLLKFVPELKKRASDLPGIYAELKDSAIDFADQIGAYEIPQTMEKAVKAAENQDGKETLRFASLALEKMKELAANKKDTPFGSLLERKMKFSVPEFCKNTLQQMLDAMGTGMGRGMGPGLGTGFGGGGGMLGGDPGDGYWSGGISPLNVPVFGPERMSFESPSGMAGRGRSGVGRVGRGASETMGLRETTPVRSESMPVEAMPEKYRNAIKKYFSTMEEEK